MHERPPRDQRISTQFHRVLYEYNKWQRRNAAESVQYKYQLVSTSRLVQIDSDHDLHGGVKNSRVVVYVCEDMVRQNF